MKIKRKNLPGTACIVKIWEWAKVREEIHSAGEVKSNRLTLEQVALLLHSHTMEQLPTRPQKGIAEEGEGGV